MSNDIDIRMVANAGVLVEHDGAGLLVDGIHREGGHPFSPVSEADLARMRKGESPFAHLDYLFFTHEHPDHCTPGLVREQVRERPVRGLLLPGQQGGSPELARLLEGLQQQGVPYQTLGLPPGRTQRFELADGLSITALGTRHMGPQYRNVRNDCLLLSWDGANLLFTGDADPVADYYAALRDVPLEAAFVNPLFLHDARGREIITTLFRPRRLVVHHLPFPADDTLHFGYMVNRDREKLALARPEMQFHVLDQPEQRMRLPAPDAPTTR